MLSFLRDFARTERRQGIATELAAHFGVDSVLFFTRDPELHVMIPAPGFPQTLLGGRSWRSFVRAMAQGGVHHGTVDFEQGGLERSAVAFVEDCGGALVLVGGTPVLPAVGGIFEVLPLLHATLVAEARMGLAAQEVRKSQARAARNRDLVTALDAAREDVEKALLDAASSNERLAEADRLKDEFLAMLGHELRNPLSGILGAAYVLRTKNSETPAAKRAQAVLDRQTSQLARLVDDLLDVSRIKQGKITLEPASVDVAEIVDRAVESVRSHLERKAHHLSVDVAPSLFVTADRTRLEQMVTNLLTNAARYTDQGGSISIRASREGGEVTIRVEDNGIGIPETMLETIFDPFIQAGTSMDRSVGGLGIGLMLVHRLAELHGGHVDVQSQVGRGSAFTLRLTEHVAKASVPPAPPVSKQRAAFERRRVLVIDDNVDSADMIAAAVVAWNHDVERASDGYDALEAAVRFEPEVVLLDIGLPGLDGYEVARKLRAMPQTADSLIIAISGYALERDRALSRQAGFDLHLAKPIDYEELGDAIVRRRATADDDRITA